MNSKRKAWLVMLAVYLASIAVALNLAKVPPAMQVLLRNLRMDMATGGWLMSALAVAGVILGIPAALVLDKVGPKRAGLIALGCTALGSSLGALASDPAPLLLGRVVEGVGLGLIAVVAPAVISLWFPPQARGTPMGVWASWVPVGGFVMFNLAGPLIVAFGWQGMWWFGALFALIAFVVYAAIVGPPPAVATDDRPRESGASFGRLVLNPASWILALVFGAFNFAAMGYATWAPTYFSAGLGVSLETASFDASLSNLTVIPATIIAGWLLDRVENRRLVMILALVMSGVLLTWSFQLGSAGAIVPFMLALGGVLGFTPTTTFTLAPETMPHPQYAGLALGIVSVGQNLGMFFGPPVVAAAIAGENWAAGVTPLVAAIAVGAAAAAWLPIRRTRVDRNVPHFRTGSK